MALFKALVGFTLLMVNAVSSSNLRGSSSSNTNSIIVPPQDVSWAHEWLSPHITGKSDSPRRRLRSRFGKTSNVAFCQDAPDGSAIQNNLMTKKNKQKNRGWKTVQKVSLSTVKDDNDVDIITATDREADTDGPETTFTNLAPGTYQLTGWAKLAGNEANHGYLRTSLRQSGQALTDGQIVAMGLAKKECWTKVAGGFTITETTNVTMHVGGPPANTTLQVASFAVQSVNGATWRELQNARIETFRKRDIVLRIRDKNGNVVRAFLEVDQTVSEFPFGAAISGAFTVDQEYQSWFKKRFTWAVYENEAKWYYNEPYQGAKNYNDTDKMTEILESLNINIRGHTVLWDVERWIQPWLKKLSKADLLAATNNRVQEVVSRYKGKFAHWDVNNEMLHGNFAEDNFGADYTASVFKKVESIDPATKKFVNDYDVVEYYYDKEATPETYLADIYDLQARGATVDGIGVQGHFSTVDGPRIKAELDALATAKIPIWFTELDVNVPDPNVQADLFETVMREAFSHPSVAGILQWEVARPPCSLWNYIDGSKCTKPCNTCLTDQSYVDRPIGERYVRLRKEWSTHLNRWNKKDGNYYFRGFFGKYRIRIAYQGKKYERFFYVPGGSTTFTTTIKLPV